MNRFSDTLTEERAVAALSRLVHKFMPNGKPGAKVIDFNGFTRVHKLAPDVEAELQDAMTLLKAHGRNFE